MIVAYSALGIGLYYTEKKMIGHQTRLRENHDLPLWRAPAMKNKMPCFNVRAQLLVLQLGSCYRQVVMDTVAVKSS